MPTGRPDYWYGTALYFEDSPADGEVTRGPTSNWAFDHKADADAHHADFQAADAVTAMGVKADSNPLHHDRFTPELAQQLKLGEDLDADQRTDIQIFSSTSATPTFELLRWGGFNGVLKFIQNGTGDIEFKFGENVRMKLLNAGGVEEIWDDTPTNGQVTKGVTSDWGYDHVNAAAAHHSKYTDAEAELACEAIVDDTPVNGATDQPVSSNWAFDHAASATAHHALGDLWADDGNTASFDRTLANWTRDDTWRDWDISALVGSKKCLVLIRCYLQNDTAGQYFAFRTNGFANDGNAAWFYQQPANVANNVDLWVETDASGVIEYRASNGGTWAAISVLVRGRFEVVT